MDGEGDAVVALVRVAAEDVLLLPNFLTFLLARTLSGHLAIRAKHFSDQIPDQTSDQVVISHLASIRFYFLLKVKCN